MVDFNLRKLSAPLEKLRPQVQVAYKCLDEKWDAVEKALKKLPIPCDAGFNYGEDSHGHYWNALEWRKWNGRKRLCIVAYCEDLTPVGPEISATVTPYEEWSGEQRIQMLEYVPQLFEAATKQTKEFIARATGKGDAASGAAK